MTPREAIIADAPLDPEDVLCTQDLFSSDQTLAWGKGDLAVREASVTLGKPTVYVLPPAQVPGSSYRPDARQWRFVAINFRFDLEELPPGRSYTEARFAVKFDDSQAIALELRPDVVVTEADVQKNRTITLGSTLHTAGIDISLGNATMQRQCKFSRLRPVITSFGAGTNSFSWKFEADQAFDLFPCSRAVLALLQMPKASEQFTGTISFSTQVSRRIAGIFTHLTADPGGTQPFTIQPADATFTLS